MLLPFWGTEMEFHFFPQIRKVLKANLCFALFSPVKNESLVFFFVWHKHIKKAKKQKKHTNKPKPENKQLCSKPLAQGHLTTHTFSFLKTWVFYSFSGTAGRAIYNFTTCSSWIEITSCGHVDHYFMSTWLIALPDVHVQLKITMHLACFYSTKSWSL